MSNYKGSARWKFVVLFSIFALIVVACGGDAVEEDAVDEEEAGDEVKMGVACAVSPICKATPLRTASAQTSKLRLIPSAEPRSSCKRTVPVRPTPLHPQ